MVLKPLVIKIFKKNHNRKPNFSRQKQKNNVSFSQTRKHMTRKRHNRKILACQTV